MADHAELAPDIEALVDQLPDGIDADCGFDFMQRVARPPPARVFASMMGIECDDEARFITWSNDLAAFIGAPMPTLRQARSAQHSLLDMGRYFQSRQMRRAFSADDLVGPLAHAASDGSIEEDAELLAQCAMLLFAGHETTRNLLGNGLYHPLSRPGLWNELQREPGRLTGAVRELLPTGSTLLAARSLRCRSAADHTCASALR